MNIDKQIVTDLFEVISSQHKLLTFLVANDQGIVSTLSNSPSVPLFADAFRNHQEYALAHPRGSLSESLEVMQHKLDAIRETLKRDIGGWDN